MNFFFPEIFRLFGGKQLKCDQKFFTSNMGYFFELNDSEFNGLGVKWTIFPRFFSEFGWKLSKCDPKILYLKHGLFIRIKRLRIQWPRCQMNNFFRFFSQVCTIRVEMGRKTHTWNAGHFFTPKQQFSLALQASRIKNYIYGYLSWIEPFRIKRPMRQNNQFPFK